jgi:hypothetical protein
MLTSAAAERRKRQTEETVTTEGTTRNAPASPRQRNRPTAEEEVAVADRSREFKEDLPGAAQQRRAWSRSDLPGAAQ